MYAKAQVDLGLNKISLKKLLKSAKYVGLYLSQICDQPPVFNGFCMFLRGKEDR